MSIRAPSLVVAARAILLVLAALATAYAFMVSTSSPSTSRSAQRYVCPMHPEVTAAEPATCPICGMALEVRSRTVAQASARPEPAQRQQRVVDVARRRTFSQEQRASAWMTGEGVVRALLYQDDVASLEPGERAAFRAGGAAPVAVQLGPGPPVPWDARTSMVDFRVERTSTPLRPGTAGVLELRARPRTVLIVSSSAVLESGAGPYVFAAADGRTFSRRPVAVGKTSSGLTAIVSGLREQEPVLIRGAFFVDSQARLDAEPESMAAAGR